MTASLANGQVPADRSERTLCPIILRDAQRSDVSALLSQPKRLALLIYLAASDCDGGFRRDSLIALLWPELSQEHARNALNKFIYFVLTALGRGRSSVAVAAGSP